MISDYVILPGWEEGVVERLQRLLRPEVLTRLSVNVPENIFIPVEAGHEYSRYIVALDKLRGVLNTSSKDFYQDLLATPLKDQPNSIIQRGRQLPADEFRAFQ